MLVQVPNTFNKNDPCIVAAPSSGSRGIYGAIGTAGEWGLKKGRIGGVALDVYEEEEGVFFEDHSNHILQDDTLARLLTFPNVVITSHQAFLTNEALAEIARAEQKVKMSFRFTSVVVKQGTKWKLISNHANAIRKP